MDDFTGIEIDLDNPNQNSGSTREWFELIFGDNHYMQTQAQFNALDEGTKAQVRTIFDCDVFQK